jgi:hypothetical protein
VVIHLLFLLGVVIFAHYHAEIFIGLLLLFMGFADGLSASTRAD